MYNLCGRTVQFRRFDCSILAVALFNSKRSGCSTLAEYSFGRPIKFTPDDFDVLIKQWHKGILTPEEIAERCNMSIATFYRRLRESKIKK